jgi:hypothetical protein
MRIAHFTILAAVGLASTVALGSDHRDGPRATAQPSADLTDLFSWWSQDHSRLNVILNAYPNVASDDWADPTVAYVVHLSGHAERGGKPQARLDLACRFADSEHVHCELGHEVAEGAVGEAVASASDQLRIVAGRRPDPAVWNRTGYEGTIHAIHEGIFGGEIQLEYDDAGCPLLEPAVRELIQTGLSHGADGAEPENAYAGQQVVSLELSIARELLPAGDKLGIWAATYAWQVQP